MSVLRRVTTLLRWPALAVGEAAPKLSLTADEGTWLRLEDFVGHVNVALLFFRRLDDDATDAWLKAWSARREAFEKLDTAIFGVTTHRTEKLRDYRASLGLEFFLLYDPLGMDARGFRATSRWRPAMKNNVVIVGKDGKVHLAERGMVEPGAALALLAGLEGAEVPVEEEREEGFTGVRDPGKGAAAAKKITADEAVKLLAEPDTPWTLLDVRTPSEFEADHAPGARLIPLDELPHRYQEIGQTTHIICIGQVGDRAVAAAEFLTSIGGSEIAWVEGGMASWTGDRATGPA